MSHALRQLTGVIEAPDLIEPLLGWRSWSLIADGAQLVSPIIGTAWDGVRLSWNGTCSCPVSEAQQLITEGPRSDSTPAQQLHLPETLRQRHAYLQRVAAMEYSCGINAFASMALIERDSDYLLGRHSALRHERPVAVLGVVALTGRVRQYERAIGTRRETWTTSSPLLRRQGLSPPTHSGTRTAGNGVHAPTVGHNLTSNGQARK